jgi:hypothetical protein
MTEEKCTAPCHPCVCEDCPCDSPEIHKMNDCVHSHLENDSCVLFSIPVCDPTGKGCYFPICLRDKMLHTDTEMKDDIH